MRLTNQSMPSRIRIQVCTSLKGRISNFLVNHSGKQGWKRKKSQLKGVAPRRVNTGVILCRSLHVKVSAVPSLIKPSQKSCAKGYLLCSVIWCGKLSLLNKKQGWKAYPFSTLNQQNQHAPINTRVQPGVLPGSCNDSQMPYFKLVSLNICIRNTIPIGLEFTGTQLHHWQDS